MSGTGELTYVEGHRYIGKWDNNKKNGFGVFAYARGHKYEGMWRGMRYCFCVISYIPLA